MARVKIVRPDGSPSPYFWNDSTEADAPLKTFYKKTSSGVKRHKRMRYDLANNTFKKA